MRQALLLIALAASISACAGGPASLGGPAPLTPTQRYALRVEPGIDRIALAVHETGLSENQHAALRDLLHRFSAAGAPEIVVEAPYGAGEPSTRAAWAVQEALQRSGAPVRVVSYAAPDPSAPILAGFEVLRAARPQCGTAWGALTRTGDNLPASNFGCAVTANLAAQIADPRDIAAPRAMSPADAGRRGVVFSNYRAGEITSAEREPLIEGQAVSQAVE